MIKILGLLGLINFSLYCTPGKLVDRDHNLKYTLQAPPGNPVDGTYYFELSVAKGNYLYVSDVTKDSLTIMATDSGVYLLGRQDVDNFKIIEDGY